LTFVAYEADGKPYYYFILTFAIHFQPMPSNANRQFLDFEKPIKDLIETIEKYKHDAEKNKMDMTSLSASWKKALRKKERRSPNILRAGNGYS
jgi:Acetyl-CoA carboxylase alpha subunit